METLCGYLYVVKSWLNDNMQKDEENIKVLYKIVDNLINNTDFSYLYDKEQRIFSIA